MAEVAIAGGHGQIALLLTRELHERGDVVRSIIRDPDHSGEVEQAGGDPVELDLEACSVAELAEVVEGCDAVVFAAGAGPGSGAARKETVDYGAAVKLRDAALQAGVDRYVMISAMGTDDPPQGDSVFNTYLRAKARADRAVMDSDLDWTILRPGRLRNGVPAGTVALSRHVERGVVSRADTAAVVAALLVEPATIGKIAELVEGDVPIADAVQVLART